MAKARKDHVRKGRMPSAAAHPAGAASGKPVAKHQSTPHPCLVEIVRLLARHAAKDDIAAQRANNSEE